MAGWDGIRVAGLSLCWSFVVAGWGGIRMAGLSLPHGYHPNQPQRNSNTHRNKNTHNQCGDTIEKSQAPDDECINVRNMLSIEEVKQNLINCDIKLVSYY